MNKSYSPFPFILSLILGEHLNAITLSEFKVKSSPVAGFLPLRGAFFFAENFPNPLMRTSSPFAREVLTVSRTEEVKRLTADVNPKISLGIKWLATYISLRPGELLNVKEGDIDLGQGYLIIPHPKEKRPKLVPLLPEDVELIKALPTKGLPHVPFFRHEGGVRGCKAGLPFGEKYLYKWWKRACANLGIPDVDLYGGTRQSSAMALRQIPHPRRNQAGHDALHKQGF